MNDINDLLKNPLKMPPQPEDAPAILMIPPMLLVVFIAAGFVFNWVVGLFVNFGLGHNWGWLGLVLLAGSIGLNRWATSTFIKFKTNVNPSQPAHLVVTDGPFRYTRNPMYVSMMLFYAGIALLAGAVWMIIVLLPLFYALDQKTIVPEESYMEEKFGEEYLEYKKKVRRWI